MEYFEMWVEPGFYILAIIAGIKMAKLMYIGSLLQLMNYYDVYKRHFDKEWLSVVGHIGKREYERRIQLSSVKVKQARIYYFLLPFLFIFAPEILSAMYEANWIIIVSCVVYVIIILFPTKVLF